VDQWHGSVADCINVWIGLVQWWIQNFIIGEWTVEGRGEGLCPLPRKKIEFLPENVDFDAF